jgi:hypothetical protein
MSSKPRSCRPQCGICCRPTGFAGGVEPMVGLAVQVRGLGVEGRLYALPVLQPTESDCAEPSSPYCLPRSCPLDFL